MKKFIYSLFTLLILTVATAQAQHSDVLITNVAGKVTIGAASDAGGPHESFDLETKVFETVFTPGFSPVDAKDYEAAEPGFESLHATSNAAELLALGAAALPANSEVSIAPSNFQLGGNSAELFYWNGIGSVQFEPAPADISFSLAPTIFATTGSQGDMHSHPIFQLDAATGVPADGVYLAAPVVDVAGLATSDPFYVVLLADALITGEDDAELVEEALEGLESGATTDALVTFPGNGTKDFAFYEAAVDFTADQVAIPEPNTVLLAIAALGCLNLGRNRRLCGRQNSQQS